MNRTRIVMVSAFVALSAVVACGRDQLPGSAFPVLGGPFLGQKGPGAKAALFAPGIVSTGMTERRLAVSPDGKDILFEQAVGRIVTIMETRLENGRWTEPAVPSFAADLDFFSFEPAFTPDGKTALFLCTRPRAGQTAKPGWGNQAIWAADRREDGGWSAPRDLGAPVNTDAGEFYPSVANDGTLYFTRAGVSGGNPKIMRARRVGNGYAEPEALPDAVNGRGPTYNACIAPDESFLIACRQEKAEGGRPEVIRYLVFFRAPDGSWTEGADPGPEVNLAGAEANAPSLTPDGRYLFFGSTASPGLKSLAPGRLTSRRLFELFSGPQNGDSDIYWIDASVIDRTRERAQGQDEGQNVERLFREPPAAARPGVWWHWMGSNVSRQGITRDLEALKEAGFGGATIFGLSDTVTPWPCPISNSPTPGLVAYTDPWWKLVAFAASEARRLGLDLGVHDCPGYTHSGGPWIPPELSMMELCRSETRLTGGRKWAGTLPRPAVDPRANTYYPSFNEDAGVLEKPVIEGRRTFYRDIAVLALPAADVARKDQIVDLTGRAEAEGRLEWDAPPGEWVVYRFGYTTMGSMTMPNQWRARGLECDKMSAGATAFHIRHVLEDMKRNLGGLVGTGLKHVLFDSYEAGTPTWTPKMPEEFARRRGYALVPWLPVLAGRIVESDAETKRFRADFDRTRSDLYRDEHFATVSRLLREAGLEYQCEPYVGPWQVGEVAPYVSRVMTEFWANKGVFEGALAGVDDGIMNGGHNVLEAEAFTLMPEFSKWTEYPDWLKPVGDGAFCAGINRLVLHQYVHQPWDSRYRPGNTMGLWGTHFGRLQTWWEPGQAWVAYLSRCQALLQWGRPEAGGFRVDGNAGALSLKAVHRAEGATDVFFVANQARTGSAARCVFAAAGRRPELWDPVTGTTRELPEFTTRPGECVVPLEFAPVQSWFVVFRKKTSAPGAAAGAVTANFPVRRPVIDALPGPWTVRFDPAWGPFDAAPGRQPGEFVFEKLEDWTKRPEPGIRYYSGTAVYRSSFACPAAAAGRPCFLDLGRVNFLARVCLNGRGLGVVWTAPWGVAIPAGLLRDGPNSLEIEVTNVWANRLIGDEQEPEDCEWLPGHVFGPNLCGGRYLGRFPDWFVKKEPRPSKGRYCFTTWNYFTKDSPLTPSGLMGPVRLLEEDRP